MQSRSSTTRWRHRYRAVAIFAVAGLVSMLLAACGGGSSATSASSTGSEGTASLLSLAATAAPTSLNPALAQNNESDSIYYQLAYEPLIRLAQKGQYAPGLATAWKYTDAAHEHFEMTIRSGVKFSDGTAMTADTVAASIRYFLKAGGPVASSYTKAITGVTATGSSTVAVVSSSPNPNLPLLFSQALLAGMVIGPDGVANPKSLGTSTDGAGPYMLTSSGTVSGNIYTFVPNPHYYDPSAIHYKKVTVQAITDSTTALAALQTGKIDYFQGDATVAKSAQGQFAVYTQPTVIQGFNLLDRGGAVAKPLGSQLVRQAMLYAVNRAAIAKALFNGYASPVSQISLPGSEGYDPSLEENYSYNPTKAKQLLAQAGYPNGFSTTVISVQMPAIVTLTQAIVAQLASVGIKLTIKFEPFSNFVDDVATKAYPIMFLYYGQLPMYFEGEQLLVPNAGYYNAFESTDTQLTDLLNQAAQAPDSTRNGIYQKAMDRLTNLGWFLPVVAADDIYITSKSLKGITLGPDDLYPNPAEFYNS